jgi:hypothetical protein
LNSNDISEECSSKQCRADVDLDNGEKSILPFCAATDGIKLTRLWFKMEFDLTFQFFSWEYKFGCNYNNCNNETIVDHVITIFHKAYDPQSIGQVFGYKEEEETTATSTKTSKSQEPTSSVLFERNHGLHCQSIDTITCIAPIIFMAYLLFLM